MPGAAGLPVGLAALWEAARARTDAEGGLPEPPFASIDRAPVASWLGQLRNARAAHDAHALAWREAVDEAAAELTGTTVEALLGPSGPVSRHTMRLASPDRTALTARIGALRGTEGPARRVAGGPGIDVFVTAPDPPPPGPAPVIVSLHGGAYWMGGGDVSRVASRWLHDHLARRLSAVVLDVDYRLAPEEPFPASIVDTLEVLEAVRRGIPGLDLDPGRIGLLGTSSGGNAAAVAALVETAHPPTQPIAALGLIVPSLDLTGPLPPDRQHLLRAYAGDAPREDPWLSPARHPQLHRLPPTFVATGRYDEVARGGELFVERMESVGGAVRHETYPMTHTAAEPRVEARLAEDLCRFFGDALA